MSYALSKLDSKDVIDCFTPIHWTSGRLKLIDQRALPREEIWVDLASWRAGAEAIRDMVVRGAPAIGITAAYSLTLAARQLAQQYADLPFNDRVALMEEAYHGLSLTRPTAVNLFWALDRVASLWREAPKALSAEELAIVCEREALLIHQEDVSMCRQMGVHGASFLKEDARVLTHCNTGALATGGHGTALGVIRSAWTLGRLSRVYADETRPFLQGSRLTAWELQREGIPTRVICDSMPAYLMQRGEIDAVFVGADRIAANGDTANKIGTYGLAIIAQAHNVPFYVVAPTSTVDLATPSGAEIPIEHRAPSEVTHCGGHPIAPEGIEVENPAFDVTPARYISAIITERGAVMNPTFSEELRVQLTPVNL